METKYTPGPWRIEHEHGDKPYIVAEQGKNWNNPVICQLYEDVTPEDSVTIGSWLRANDNAAANAALIAASPELLEALREACEWLEAQPGMQMLLDMGNPEVTKLFEHCRAAIAKAEGVR